MRIRRIGGGVSFSRPLGNNWTATVGTLAQNISSRDADGSAVAFDEEGNPLTFSASRDGGAVDDLWTFPLSATWDRRNDPFNPTSGGILRLNTEQSIPIGRGSIFMNRLRGQLQPLHSRQLDQPLTTVPRPWPLTCRCGTIVGRPLPPYRGLFPGGAPTPFAALTRAKWASGRSYAQFTAEYRFPLFIVSWGRLYFFDAGLTLGSGNAVPGAPGPSRDKPGSGFGYGAVFAGSNSPGSAAD